MPLKSSCSAVPVWCDLVNERLWYDSQVRGLRPKTFALLRYLVEHPGQLLTKAALLDVLWPETAVSEVVLAVCMRELRRALGDDARTPRFIETVHRRGYRFIGHLPTVHPSAAHTAAPAPLPLLVGRAHELAALHRGLATALTGVRQILFVTGEAGLGKTTLVDTFLTAVAEQGRLWIGRGQCLDHYGVGEAYLPVLEALERLCRGPEGPEVVEILRHQAPTWLMQMPGLVNPVDLEELQRRVLGTTRERMLRELAEALNVLTAARPLVLVLEDLHWSDYATLDALVALAQRREPARLLLLGTYRPPDVLQRGHPLHTVQHELHMHGQCAALPLTLLPEAAVADYLAVRFPDAHLLAGLARLVYQRTEGNPLFMVQVVEDWMHRGWLAQVDGRWTLQVGLAALAITVPEGLRQMLEQHLERLSLMEQRVLEVGSVAGATFSAAAAAAGLEAEVVQVEEYCASLARRRQWLEACGEQSWPDGTVAGAYRFTHALYQEVAYTRLSAARRVAVHRQIGVRVEAGYGTHVGTIAVELAVHFEQGRDPDCAIRYLQHAADTALRRCASSDAITHLTKALALLSALPETPARVQRELDVHLALGPALLATKGLAALEVEQTYARARELCRQVGETSQLFPTLGGLWSFYYGRGALATARELGDQLYGLAQRTAEPTHLLEAHDMLGCTLVFLGDYPAARLHLEQGIALAAPTAQWGQVLRSGVASGVACLAFTAITQWCLGYPAQALRRSQEALALAQELAHPYSLAVARYSAAWLHHRRREAPAVQEWADALLTLATAQEFPLHVGYGTCWRGWALAMQDQREAGLEALRQGMAAVLATGQLLSRAFCLVLLAEAVGHTGQVEEGLALLAEALEAFAASGRGDMLTEAYRLQGRLLLCQDTPDAPQAEACFQQALAVARHQQAKAWELRAAMSLSRLWQQQGKREEARALLAPLYSWFTEGFDTADLQEAKALLDELRG